MTRSTRIERRKFIQASTSTAIGVFGALVGWFILRFLVAITGAVAMFVGAILGAMALIWLWRTYISK